MKASPEQGYPEQHRFWRLGLGAAPLDGGAARFRVWAPRARELAVRILSGSAPRTVPLRPQGGGYFGGIVEGAGAGDRYLYLLDGTTARPDPASRSQPDGVHAPSQVVDPDRFTWTDSGWTGIPRAALVIYELHVGTFTREGTFAAAVERLDYLADLGVTAVELMPVAQFPGARNWGYDGVYPFAPQNSYGRPDDLKALVDACHRKGLAVILDVLYNHLGPEGNYLAEFGPYFTDRYRTPWGDAVNFDGPDSDPVRHFFISNALYWVREFHMDGLRIDAIHGIFDFGARHFLGELAAEVGRLAEALGRRVHVIAESDLNDARVTAPQEMGGYGLAAQWNDDFHHALHALLTRERDGYYADFGDFAQLATAYREGFVFSGGYSSYRRRRHGSSTAARPAEELVVFSQNHDQVGNRLRGDRPAATLSLERLKLAAGTVLLSPYLPLLFMGEEYGETAPFPYFTSHGDPVLAAAVRQGRREEFAAFGWQEEVPDPQDEAIFRAARLDPGKRHGGMHRHLFALYRELLRLRRELPPLARLTKDELEVTGFGAERVLAVGRGHGNEVLILFNFSGTRQAVAPPVADGSWRVVLASADEQWGGNERHAGETFAANTTPAIALAPDSFILWCRE